MNTYAMLLVIEERALQQFPVLGRLFRAAGDVETADGIRREPRNQPAKPARLSFPTRTTRDVPGDSRRSVEPTYAPERRFTSTW